MHISDCEWESSDESYFTVDFHEEYRIFIMTLSVYTFCSYDDVFIVCMYIEIQMGTPFSRLFMFMYNYHTV